MKKTQVALAALALVASSAALATEVKLSGVIDIGVGYTSKTDGVGGMYMENGAYNDHSALDLNISEDLGNGLKAYASLGMGFNPNGQSDNPGLALATGNDNNSLFNRQSFVGLSSNDLGSIQLGKQLSPYVLSNVMMMNYNGMFGVGRMTLVPGGTAGAFFVNDAIQYQSPSLAGFTVTAMTTTKGSTRNNTFYEATGVAAGGESYNAISVMGAIGPFNATAAYHSVKNTVSGWNIGGTIDLIEGLTGSIGYMSGKNEGEERVGSWNIGAAYALTPSLKLSAQYAHAGSTAEYAKKSLLNVMLAQSLSKRTTAYATYGRGKNVGAAIGTLAGGIAEEDRSNNSFVVGVSHAF